MSYKEKIFLKQRKRNSLYIYYHEIKQNRQIFCVYFMYALYFFINGHYFVFIQVPTRLIQMLLEKNL